MRNGSRVVRYCEWCGRYRRVIYINMMSLGINAIQLFVGYPVNWGKTKRADHRPQPRPELGKNYLDWGEGTSLTSVFHPLKHVKLYFKTIFYFGNSILFFWMVVVVV